MGSSDLLDVRHLRLSARLQASGTSGKAERRTEKYFVKFPSSWVDRLGTAKRISTYRIALYLLHQHWRTTGRALPLSNVALVSAGVSRREKWRGLEELESAGLVKIERRPRKSPIITLLLVL
jgi:hypothetical protein